MFKTKRKTSERTKALAKADKYFSLWYRSNEADENGIVICCTCGKIMKWKAPDASTHFGHWQSRGIGNTRFDPMNGGIQCKRENKFQEGEKKKMEAYLIKRYGEYEVRQVEIRARISRTLNNFELAAIAAHFKKQYERLAKQKGL